MFIFFGIGPLQADNIHLNGTAASAEMTVPTYLSDFPVRKPLKTELNRNLLDFAQLAWGNEGKMDNTSVRSGTGTFAQRSNPSDSKDSIEIIANNCASLGQNTNSLSPLNDRSNQAHHDFTLSRGKRISKESPTDHPLGFAWEHLQTKK